MAISKLLNGWVQLMKLFYDQPHFISRPQIEGNLNFKIDRNEIPDNLSIIVRPGSTLPVSKPMRRLEYQQLYARGDLDPVSFFKLMDYPNPEKLAYRVLNWKKFGILSDNPPPQGQIAQPMGQSPFNQPTLPSPQTEMPEGASQGVAGLTL